MGASQPAFQNGSSDASGYGAATGYLPANGYNGNGHNGNGQAYPTREPHDGQGGYGSFDYQNLGYPDVDYQHGQPVANGYPQQNSDAGQLNERGYGEPDLAYGQDGYQGYTGYGPGGR